MNTSCEGTEREAAGRGRCDVGAAPSGCPAGRDVSLEASEERMWENPRMADTPASEQPDGLDWSRVSRFNRDKPQVDYPGSLQATSAASFLSGAAWLFTVLVVIIGVALVIYKDPLFDRITGVSFFTRHPHAMTGITFVIYGSILMMAIVMVANFVKAMMAFNAMAGAFFQAFAVASDETKSSGSDAQAEDAHGPQTEPPAQTSANTMSHTPAFHGSVPGWYRDPYGKSVRWWDGNKWAGL